MLKRIECADRERWLAMRGVGIGGSEAAAAIGMSPWQTPVELWKLKCGYTEPKDISGNAAVAQGVRMEPILRDFFMALNPQYRLEYHPYDLMYQSDREWLFATLDGELIDSEGRYGILEIKTGTPNGKVGWDKWANGQMPSNYYIQCCHQLLATGYSFVRLFACLYSMNGDMTIKTYEIERADVEEDLAWLSEQEADFWHKVETHTMPAMPLML